MWIKTIHGKFVFGLQKYQCEAQETNYLSLTNQLQEGYVSPRLQELCGYYSNRMSYEEVALLVERVSGERLLSDQKIRQIVSNKALIISQDINKTIAATLAKNDDKVVQVNANVDIYNPEEKEILLFDDGIQVKSQKAERQPKLDQSKKNQNLCRVKTPAIITDIVLLQKPTTKFEYIATPINANGEDLLSLASVIKAKILQEYGSQASPLNLVAITDGARTIRHRLLSIFGLEVTIILDWYHLCKKLRELMSMIANNKLEKAKHLKFLFSQLWQGNTAIALGYLKHQVQVRNLDKWQELIGYLEKHQHEIINYKRRSQAGKTLGSGRIEKGVDLTVGLRQKNKGMSWSRLGSRALSLLKVAELNGQWQQLWFPAPAA
ncbi:MAG: hypothetical protein CLLPBCKN_006168 [Chroococcidiopsis cubana SAG 39.79]|uniref:ISKra4 family transposase n=2 Tax=Chroococcidiopsis TaxID=54298 RepID=A0AB37UGZ9_9CYAN|nr:hypothetical protein [Chroococcidiopsis cubana SAG 39.79]PSB65948.1 hypothetical protein C7B79_03170 [Chroococcidiopsis cubana CCALA 043]RUT10576.1 hypothetical protein DSM107010_41430 [Chroococcidiopsis cubana SAG 39.79]